MHKNAFKVKMRTFAQKMTIVDASEHPKLCADYKETMECVGIHDK